MSEKSSDNSEVSIPKPLTVTDRVITRIRSYPEVDGLRSIMTMWVIYFHVLWHVAMFAKDADEFQELFLSPSFIWRFLSSGLNAVDVFFIMTGFLTLIPVILKVRQDGWLDFMILRLTRVYPALITTLLFFCVYLTNFGVTPLMTWEGHPSHGIIDILKSVGSPLGDGPSHACDMSLFNILFINNFIPFGGCMGWTWSLCIQVQFYAIFPLIIKWFGFGKRFLKMFALAVIGTIAMRAVVYIYIVHEHAPASFYIFDADQLTSFFVHFNIWYSSSFQRMICIIFGVALGVIHFSFPNVGEYLRKKKALGYALLLIAFHAIYFSYTMNRVEPVPWQMSIGTVGGPYWLYGLSYLMYDLIERITIFGQVFGWILSRPFWSYISIPSYGMYLVHSIFSLKAWEWYRLYYGPVFPINVNHYWIVATLVFLASWLYGALVYHIVEKNTIKIRKIYVEWKNGRKRAAQKAVTTIPQSSQAPAEQLQPVTQSNPINNTDSLDSSDLRKRV